MSKSNVSKVKSLLSRVSSVKKDRQLSGDQKYQTEKLVSSALQTVGKDVEMKYKQSPASVTKGERDAYEMIEKRPLSERLRSEHFQDKYGLTRTYRAKPETRAMVSQVVNPQIGRELFVQRAKDDTIQPEREALRASLYDVNRRPALDACGKQLCASCQACIGQDMIRIMLDMFRVEMYERWMGVQESVQEGALIETDAIRLGKFMMDRMNEVVNWMRKTPSEQIVKMWLPFTHLLFRYMIDIVNEVSFAIWTAKRMLNQDELPFEVVETVDEVLAEPSYPSSSMSEGSDLGPSILKIVRVSG